MTGTKRAIRVVIVSGPLPGANIAQVGLASFANSAKMHRDAVDAGNLVITIGEVRLNGIDVPETGQPFSTVSKSHLSSLVFGRDVVVIGQKIDVQWADDDLFVPEIRPSAEERRRYNEGRAISDYNPVG